MSNSNKKWGDTISKKGEVSRVFCGNLEPTFECIDLENRFKKYGEILGIDINNNGKFAFIQFDRVEDAQRAVIGENKKLLKNRALEVRMFGKSKKKRDRSRSPFNRKNKMQRREGLHKPPHLENRRFFNSNFNQQSKDVSNQNLMNSMTISNQSAPQNSLLSLDQQITNFQSIYNNLNNQNLVNQSQQQPNPQTEFNKPQNFNDQLMNSMTKFTSSVPPTPQGNELEIIVMNRAQWAYCEMLEKRFRQETCLKFIDLVFPHSADMISVTLKDLYEKKTLYAVVVNPVNEQNNTFVLHILHNQTIYDNVSISDGINLICQDFVKEIANPESSYYRQKQSSTSVLSSNESTQKLNFNNQAIDNNLVNNSQFKSMNNQDSKLPHNIAHVLKSTLEDDSAEFLSIAQIDSVIEFYTNEKAKLLAKSIKQQQLNEFNNSINHANSTLSSSSSTNNNLARDLFRNLNQANLENLMTQQQQQQSQLNSSSNAANSNNNLLNSLNAPSVSSSQLLENPQVKAALNSLIQLGALNTNTVNDNQKSTNNDVTGLANSNNYVSSSTLNYSNNHQMLSHNYSQSFGAQDQALNSGFNNNNNSGFNNKSRAQQNNFQQQQQPIFKSTRNDFNRSRATRFN